MMSYIAPALVAAVIIWLGWRRHRQQSRQLSNWCCRVYSSRGKDA